MKRNGQHQSTALHERALLTSSAQNAVLPEACADVCTGSDLPVDVAVKPARPEANLLAAGPPEAVDCGNASAVQHMLSEFKRRRKIVVTGLPSTSPDEVLDELRNEQSFSLVTEIKDGSVKLLFSDAALASDCIRKLNVSKFKGCKLTASYGHPDSLLFVGNLPFNFTNTELRQLFEGFGELLRCFMVHSVCTGQNKGYGFVEYASRSQALAAKQSVAAKTIGHRGLRVDFADNGMQTPDDLQSSTLFVDKLPKSFVEDKLLRAVFSKYGTVNFCQVATDTTGCSRGFAFVDMSSSEEAEGAQAKCNGIIFAGHEIRVAFSMPCRPGACILQHKRHTVAPVLAAAKHGPELEAPHFATSVVVHATPCVLANKTNQLCPVPPTDVLCGRGKVQSSDSDVVAKDAINDGCRKRPYESEEGEETRGVYDLPYIGQHQQGIPYLHPLKRIRIGVMSSKEILQ